MKHIYLIVIVAFLACQNKTALKINLDQPPQNVAVFGESFISTDLYERDMAISPDHQEIIYTLGDYKQSKRCLVSVKKTSSGWQHKHVLPFSGIYQDIEPFFSVDGRQLFFASNRPINNDTTRNDYNLWVVDKNGDQWGEPTALDDHINTSKDEFYPSVSSNGNLYFTATRENGIGREDIFVSKWIDGKYTPPMALDSVINTKVYEFNAYISPDEDLLVFSSYGRPDGQGGGDLYYSKKEQDGNWIPAINMGEDFNSEKLDYCPFIDEENQVFYFTSEKMNISNDTLRSIEAMVNYARKVDNGMGNIYWISADKLPFNN